MQKDQEDPPYLPQDATGWFELLSIDYSMSSRVSMLKLGLEKLIEAPHQQALIPEMPFNMLSHNASGKHR